MSRNEDLLTKSCSTNATVYTSKKGQFMKAKAVGKIEANECTLNNVLYLPGLDRNLLSASVITQNGGKIQFENDIVTVMKDDDIVLTGEKDDSGLYLVKINPLKNESSNLTVTNSVHDWHRKLGHLSHDNMKKLSKMADGFHLGKNKLDVCEVCQDAKQSRKPFKNDRTRATRPLEIIHSDLVEVETPTWNQYSYFVTCLDDFTHYTWVYLLKKKSDAPNALKEYIAMAESKWNIKVHKLRCDNGGEYVSSQFKNWCAEKGIVMDLTIPCTPQLNGSAERLNRSLMQKTRALLFDSDVDKKLWGEALLASTFLLNRSPTRALKNCTPAEKWFGKRPDLSMLKIFGSVAYAKRLTYTRKLDKRSAKCIFVGYAPNGYRLWDESKQKVIISRDVIFANEISGSPKEPVSNTNRMLTFDKKMILPGDSRNSSEGDDSDDSQGSEFESDDENGTESGSCDTTDEDLEHHNGSICAGRSSLEPTGSECQGNPDEQLGRGCRRKSLPARLKDYDLSTDDISLLTYREATTGDDKEKWMEAIREEMAALEENSTWELIDKSAATTGKTLTSRWVFKVKDDGRYRARLVVRGCQQREGIDYQEIFSPVVCTDALRTLIAYAAMKNFKFMKFDVKSAFLYGNINEDIYMSLPEGYNAYGKICKLKKALYGLKQAPAMWNQRLKDFLKKYGLTQLKMEQCVFVNSDRSMLLAIHIDDGLLAGSDAMMMKKFLRELAAEFKVTIDNNLKIYLGISFSEEDGRLKLSQESYAQNIAEKYNMADAKPVATPFAVGNKHDPSSSQKHVTFPFREAVGSLLYLSTKTRPDIALAVSLSGRHIETPTQSDVVNVKRTIKYVRATKHLGISYSKEEKDFRLQGYCDSDYAGDLNSTNKYPGHKTTARSTTGFIIYFNGGPISWASRRQPVVATASCEAEYIAATEAAKTLIYLKNFLEEITQQAIPAELYIDNQSAINLAKNGVMNRRSKHIEVRFHYIKEKVEEGLITLKYLPTEDQTADLLTKPLTREKFEKHAKNMVV